MPFAVQEPFDERGLSPALQYYEQARRLMENGDTEQAVGLFQKSAVESPHFKTFELLGECLLRLKRFSEAIPYLAAAAAMNRGVRAPAILAEAWLALERYDEALEAAEAALLRDPTNKGALKIRKTVEGRSVLGQVPNPTGE